MEIFLILNLKLQLLMFFHITLKAKPFKTLKDVREVDNALGGAFWSVPMVKSFSSFEEYEA